MKITAKKLAIKMRRSGKSYGQILECLPVAKSSLSLWLRDVPLTSKQQRLIQVRHLKLARERASKTLHEKCAQRATLVIRDAWTQFKKLEQDPFFLSGLCLYWAEGTKTNQRFCFTNSDPTMIKFFLKWLRKYGEVAETNLRVQLNIHSLHSRERVEEYWSDITKIPLTQFIKTYIKKTSLGHRKNIQYNGTCAIRVSNVKLFRK
ncbi:MAG: hypothetical protein V1821_01825, partial [bacterium]